MKKINAVLAGYIIVALVAQPVAFTAEFHVATAQEFQTALSTAAVNGEDDTIFLAAGIYKGNFNFLTTAAQALTIQTESGLKPGDVVLDGEAKGRVLNLDAGSANANFTLGTLVFRNGSINGNGGGLSARTRGIVSVSQCQFTRNSSSSGGGGGIYIANANSLAVTNNTIAGNWGSNIWGGGLFIDNVVSAYPTFPIWFTPCVFREAVSFIDGILSSLMLSAS